MGKKSKDNEEVKEEKPQINQEKIELLKNKFNFLRKVKPLKFRKSRSNYEKFDPSKIDKTKIVDMNAIWEKQKKERTAEEKYFYRKEAKTYHKYFFLYLSREVRRTRWTPRKELNRKFWITVLFIAFFAGLFALLDWGLIELFRIARIT
ncbi:preprotein translocase subunit SecE [Spiroplasma platyhelix]|uniref:Preprotein translocase subunit SecE n=1 Tax=Spiroplasma platyhelix PALS-1 TaxID=1276218 RepID=A0A846TSM1_9MOLU|nr:preprotein translocase subunit SecE [Spiroplasma platyhelix]MBE4704135.1 hypothetical protein [Spiroplasma platyhelix PALS-1]NKE38505.1 preprotein translocase subunit SecE [Spiroplasma platyhelix PALS-1]UJB29393.1 hypothetical protein SPLAT_v1c06290 [Spiroplasma platyhelix PALS-1]